MSRIITTIGSSIGKKTIMAISGFSFCTFLTAHLAGNLTIYWGKESFNNYAEHLHSLGILINIFEIGLLICGIIHITLAAILFIENIKARPVKYIVKRKAGGQTIGSSSMPYTGIFLFIFIFIHLFNFHFADKTNTSIFNIVQIYFSSVTYVCFYVIAAIITAIHVSHGFWSTFQTIGINHKKYISLIKITGSVFSLMIVIGFGFIPIYLLFMV